MAWPNDSPTLTRYRVRFACTKTFEALGPIADQNPNIRDCADCQRQVVYCDDAEALAEQVRAGRCVAVRPGLLTEALVQLAVHEPEAAQGAAETSQCRLVEHRPRPPAPKLHDGFPEAFLREHRVFPAARAGSVMTFACEATPSFAVQDELKFVSGYNLEFVVVSAEELDKLLAEAERGGPHFELGLLAEAND